MKDEVMDCVIGGSGKRTGDEGNGVRCRLREDAGG